MFFRHSLIYLLARGFPSLIAFLSIAIYTRLLDPEEFGLYTLVYTAATLLSSISFQWLRLGLLRYYQGKTKDQQIVLISTIAISFAVTAGFVGLLWVPITFFWGHVVLLVLVLLIGIVQGSYDILLERARVELSPLRFGIIALMRAVLMLGGGVLGFEFAGVQGLLIGLLVGILAIVSVEFKRVAWMVNRSCVSKAQTWQLLHFGGPLTATFALAGILGFADRYMLAWLQSTSSAGTYAAAYDLTQKIIITLMMIVNLAGYPLLLKAQADGDKLAFEKHLKLTLNGLLFIGLPVLSLFELLPSAIAGSFLGMAYQHEAVILMPWLAVAAVLEGLKVYYFDLSFQLQQHTMHQVWIVALAAGFNIILNYLLIPEYGGLGSAWATLAANILAIGLSFGVSRTQLKLPMITRDSIYVAIITLCMSAVLWELRPLVGSFIQNALPKLLLLSITAGLVYFFGGLIMNLFGMRTQAKKILHEYRAMPRSSSR